MAQRNFCEIFISSKPLWSILLHWNQCNSTDLCSGILCQYDCYKMVGTILLIAMAWFSCYFYPWINERFVDLYHDCLHFYFENSVPIYPKYNLIPGIINWYFVFVLEIQERDWYFVIIYCELVCTLNCSKLVMLHLNAAS